jgi:uncharacterized protein (TIGR02246 family)
MRNYGQWAKALLAGALLSAGGSGVAVVAGGGERVEHGPTARDPANAADEEAIRKVQAAYVQAFNAGDAKRLAAFWTADGEFVDASGKLRRGRAAIEKELAALFAEAKGARLEITTDSLRFVAPGVALESGRSRLLHGAAGGPTSAYSIVHVKRDGQWQLASVRETAYVPSSNYEHLRDLEWLVGTWMARDGDKTLELTCAWTGNRNFLMRKFTLKTIKGTTRTGVQLIGWDPVRGSIQSWVFDSDGGFGSERWTRDGPRWRLAATGVTREGVPTTATNIVTRLGQDSLQWQSIQRGIGATRLPDMAPVMVTRVKTNP